MKVRNKLFLAMVVLVVFMAGVFLAISHGYMENLFRQYAVAARQGEAEQWAAMLSYYYQQNGEAWDGVEDYVSEINHQKLSAGRVAGLERIVVRDRNHHVVFASKTNHISRDDIIKHGIQVPIVENGRKIGTLSILDRDLQRQSVLETNILALMTKATLIGALVTALAALLIGALLTRRLTNPLQLLMKAIHRIAQGDLRPQLTFSAKDEFGQVAAAFNDMAQQLYKVQEARKNLVADVAHELRTPLTIILGQLELIQQGVRKPDPETLLPIQDECMRLTRLVDDLHQLSLAEAGILPLEKHPTELCALISRLIDNFQLEAEAKEIRLEMACKVNSLYATVDAHRITQVFVNLIGNAIRYTPPGGNVVVTVRPSTTKFVVISVSDTGSGIEGEHLPHLFDRFYRVEHARSRGNGGMGLGLAIAKEYIEAHKGWIEVQSQVGVGTTFLIHLPLSATE